MTIRLVPLPPERLEDARALVGDRERPRDLLDRAVAGSREARAIAALDADSLQGLIVFGEIAGALRTGAILWIAVRQELRRHGLGGALVRQALREFRAARTRLVVAELAGSPRYEAALGLLLACGFHREGEVADFHGDGEPLVLLGHRFEQESREPL